MDDVQAGAGSAATEQPGNAGASAAVDQLAEKFTSLMAALADAGVTLAEGDDVIAAGALAIRTLSEKIGELETANGVLTTEISALEAKATAAANAPKAKVSTAPRVRKIGPVKGHAPSSAELLAAIRAAAHVELVFSDGRQEIAGIPAREISGDAWGTRGNLDGVMLRGVDLRVHGPAHGSAPYSLAGYGLLLDGKQVAWAPRPEVLAIGANQEMNLSSDVVF